MNELMSYATNVVIMHSKSFNLSVLNSLYTSLRGVVICLNCKILSNLFCVTTKGWLYFFIVFI